MTIYRAPRPDSGFTIIRNEVIRDNRLSLKARGLLLLILSRPDNWRTTAEQLAEENKEGRTAILSAFKELREVGYMRQVRERDSQGRVRTITSVFDFPESENLIPVPTREDDVLPLVTPETGSPKSDEPTPLRRTDQEEPKKNGGAKGTRLSPDWIPSEAVRVQMAQQRPDLDLRLEHENFVDYWTAKPGKDGLKLDWDATWRRWMRGARGSRPASRPLQPVPAYVERPVPDRDSLPWAEAGA